MLFHQDAQNVERPGADCHRHKSTTVINPKETAALAVETEASEQKNASRRGRIHPLALGKKAGVSILCKFRKNSERFIPR